MVINSLITVMKKICTDIQFIQIDNSLPLLLQKKSLNTNNSVRLLGSANEVRFMQSISLRIIEHPVFNI